ncbi:MAG: protein kinase [Bacteroidales bacterium]|nr:protein kinase [Bacteroidales bacterium]
MEQDFILQPHSTLQNGKYEIIGKIGWGGFGITYLAEFTVMKTRVAIKECFLSGYCVRQTGLPAISVQSISMEAFGNYKNRFIKEAQTLFQFRNHPNIIHVTDVFEENNTAYYVMDFIEGDTLESIIKQKKTLDYEDAINYLRQICDAVSAIHAKGIIHRDIKPANVMITPDNRAILIDFGTAKDFIGGTNSTQVIITPGYAPEEQYVNEMEKGCYSDIYSIGATLYTCLTGNVPVESLARRKKNLPSPKELNTKVPEHVNSTILKAMELEPSNRYQDVKTFFDDLIKKGIEKEDNAEEKPASKTVILEKTIIVDKNKIPVPPQKKSKGRKWLWVSIAVFLVAATALAGYFFLNIKNDNNKKQTPANKTDSTSKEAKQKRISDSVKRADSVSKTKAAEKKKTEEAKSQQTIVNKKNEVKTLTFPQGKYVGEVKYGRMNGYGTFYFNSGAKHVGWFRDNKFNGQGTHYFTNGDKYVGGFKDDKMSGRGTYYFANGEKYVGEFKNNMRDGYGTLYYSSGRTEKGNWRNDVLQGKELKREMN